MIEEIGSIFIKCLRNLQVEGQFIGWNFYLRNLQIGFYEDMYIKPFSNSLLQCAPLICMSTILS